MTSSTRSSPGAVRVAFVDDHPIYCEGLRSVVHSDPRLELVGEANDAGEGLALALRTQPDVLLTDIGLKKGRNGIALTADIVEQVPRTRVLVLSVEAAAVYLERARAAGARGYVNKSDLPDDLRNAIYAVAAGETHWPTGFELTASRSVLTPRELEVARLLAHGLRNAQVAATTGIVERTVERHRERIYEKLGVGTVIGIREWLEARGLLEE